MPSDEEQIRQLVATWMAASQSGDVATVLSLMTDDAVFLVPGTTVMRKADFAAASRTQSGPDAPRFEGKDGPGAEYVATLDDNGRSRLRDAVRAAYLDGEADGPRSYAALAWAVRGTAPA